MSLTHLQHSLDRRDGFFGCLFFYVHLRFLVTQACIHFLQRVHAHILTFVAAASYAFSHLRRNRNKLLIRTCTLHLKENSAFCGYYKAFGGRFDSVLKQSLGRTNYVALSQIGALHSGCAKTSTPGFSAFSFNSASNEKRLCTWHAPFQSNILRPVTELI